MKLTLGANNVPHVCPFHHIAAEAKPLGVDIELVKFARDVDLLTDSTFNALRRDFLRQIREEAGKPGAGH